ncbi:MAG: hypothetical protein AAF460_04185 [Pseudomonadota bacterium]
MNAPNAGTSHFSASDVDSDTVSEPGRLTRRTSRTPACSPENAARVDVTRRSPAGVIATPVGFR